MPSYAALLREVAAEHLAVCRESKFFEGPACDRCTASAVKLDQLADLLERVTPEVNDAVEASITDVYLYCDASLGGRSAKDKEQIGRTEDALDILRALAAGPQPEEGRDGD